MVDQQMERWRKSIAKRDRSSEPFWNAEERGRFERHLQKFMKKLIGRRRALILAVEPERVFAADPVPRMLKGSTQGRWSVWIRETMAGVSFDYNDYQRQPFMRLPT